MYTILWSCLIKRWQLHSARHWPAAEPRPGIPIISRFWTCHAGRFRYITAWRAKTVTFACTCKHVWAHSCPNPFTPAFECSLAFYLGSDWPPTQGMCCDWPTSLWPAVRGHLKPSSRQIQNWTCLWWCGCACLAADYIFWGIDIFWR